MFVERVATGALQFIWGKGVPPLLLARNYRPPTRLWTPPITIFSCSPGKPAIANRMERAIKTLIVDDEPVARQILREELNLIGGIDLVGEADDGRQALRKDRPPATRPRICRSPDASDRRLRGGPPPQRYTPESLS
jgi:hypothetical protein